jgi:hypothetical protein
VTSLAEKIAKARGVRVGVMVMGYRVTPASGYESQPWHVTATPEAVDHGVHALHGIKKQWIERAFGGPAGERTVDAEAVRELHARQEALIREQAAFLKEPGGNPAPDLPGSAWVGSPKYSPHAPRSTGRFWSNLTKKLQEMCILCGVEAGVMVTGLPPDARGDDACPAQMTVSATAVEPGVAALAQLSERWEWAQLRAPGGPSGSTVLARLAEQRRVIELQRRQIEWIRKCERAGGPADERPAKRRRRRLRPDPEGALAPRGGSPRGASAAEPRPAGKASPASRASGTRGDSDSSAACILRQCCADDDEASPRVLARPGGPELQEILGLFASPDEPVSPCILPVEAVLQAFESQTASAETSGDPWQEAGA